MSKTKLTKAQTERFYKFMWDEFGNKSVSSLNDPIKKHLAKELALQRKEMLKETDAIIVGEMIIARKNGQPTSRLTSLAVKLSRLK